MGARVFLNPTLVAREGKKANFNCRINHNFAFFEKKKGGEWGGEHSPTQHITRITGWNVLLVRLIE